MKRETLERISRYVAVTSDAVRRRFVRRDLLMNGIASALVGIVAFVVMQPSTGTWPVMTQVATASLVALVVFGIASVLFVVPEALGESW